MLTLWPAVKVFAPVKVTVVPDSARAVEYAGVEVPPPKWPKGVVKSES